MPTVKFVLTIDKLGLTGNSARLFIDENSDGIHTPQEEVLLSTSDGLTWTGSRVIDAPKDKMILLRFATAKGAKWSFVASSPGKKHFEIKDQKTLSEREQMAEVLA